MQHNENPHYWNTRLAQEGLSSRSSTSVYRWIEQHDFPKGFRTLCANHNQLSEWVRRKKDRRQHRETEE